MRKVTKTTKTKIRKTNRKTNTKIRKTNTKIRKINTKIRKTYKYILKGGVDPEKYKKTKTITHETTIEYKDTINYKQTPNYIDTIAKYKQIFGKHLDIILTNSKTAHIIELIDILRKVKDINYKNKMNNEEQTENIIQPALETFIDYAKEQVMGLVSLLNAFNMGKRIKAGLRGEYKPFLLTAKEVLDKLVTIPDKVNIDEVKRDDKNPLKTTRRNLIAVLAKKDNLVEEFIADLEILAGIELKTETSLAPSPHLSVTSSLSPPESDTESDDDNARTFLTPVSERNPAAIPVQPFFVRSSKLSEGGRNYKTINKVYNSYKKTRRHKKH